MGGLRSLDSRSGTCQAPTAASWRGSRRNVLARAQQVYNEWRDLHGSAQRSFANENFISYDSMRTIGDLRKDYAAVLADIGFLPGRGRVRDRSGGYHGELLPEYNACADRPTVLQAALVAGLAPNLLKIKRPSKFADVMGSAMQVCAAVISASRCAPGVWG